MPFPIELLPCAERKPIECDLSAHYLLRHTATNEPTELQNPVTGGVNERAVCSPKEHIADLSTNLHGIFQIAHCSIELTQEGKEAYNEYCAPDETVNVPLENIHYTHAGQRGFWAILISRLSGEIVDYNQSNQPFRAFCVVTHTPMKWNFWHFSVRWRLEDGRMLHELPEPERKKIATKVGHDARALIAMHAQLIEPPLIILDGHCYLK